MSYLTNVWGNVQSLQGIESDLQSALNTNKDVYHPYTNKTMTNADFINKTQNILKELN